MGKKKAARNKRGGRKVDGGSDVNHPKEPTDSSSLDPPNKLIAKLRSTDRSIRHSTLAALLHTSFHASALSSGCRKKRDHLAFNRPLLQAIRDQIVACDPLPLEATPKVISSYKEQLRCSILATECLGNYVCFVNADEDSYESAWVAGWIIIFMQRIQDFKDLFLESNNSMVSSDANRTIHDMHLELVEQCIIAMVHLFERNALAMDRLRVVQQPYRSNVLDIHGILTFLLQHTNSTLTSINATMATRHHLYQSIQLHAARCLHSIWDDNFNFIASFLLPSQQSGPCEAVATLETLNAIIFNTWNTLIDPKSFSLTNDTALSATTVTGLHACGAFMAAWFALHTRSEEIPTLYKNCIPICIQLVERIIMNGSPEQSYVWVRMKSLEGPLHTAYLDFCNEQIDTQLEHNVVQQQLKKMESARSIARRLKQMKTSAASDAMETNEKCSNVASSNLNWSNSNAPNHTCPSAEKKIDHTGNWEEMQIEWYDAVRPMELAVELLAAWTSPSVSDSNDDVEMGMMEDDIMIDAHVDDVKPSLPSELIANLKKFQIPTAIRELFICLTDWYKELIHGPLRPKAPIILRDSLGDLIYKTIIAMESCHTCRDVSKSLHCAGESIYSLWKLLKSFLFDIRTVAELAHKDLNVRLQSASTGAMVSLLRTQSQRPPNLAMTMEDPEWARKIFTDLLLMLDSKVADVSGNPVFVRDTVCMMGIVVCRFPTSFSSPDIFTFTEVLMSLTVPFFDPSSQAAKGRISLMILSEILNVFMDVFSEDDFYTNVFDQMKVLPYFERMIPVLKREMQQNRLQRPTDENGSMEELMEHCQETVANATRFVKYKIDLRRK